MPDFNRASLRHAADETMVSLKKREWKRAERGLTKFKYFELDFHVLYRRCRLDDIKKYIPEHESKKNFMFEEKFVPKAQFKRHK